MEPTDSEFEKAGVGPKTADELRSWVYTHPTSYCRAQLAEFLYRTTTPNVAKLRHSHERMIDINRVCGLEELGGADTEDIAEFQDCLVKQRDQHMHGKLVDLVQHLPPRNISRSQHKEPPLKGLFICGQEHVAGIPKLFEDKK